MEEQTPPPSDLTRREFIRTSVATAGTAAAAGALSFEALAGEKQAKVIKVTSEEVLEAQEVTAAVDGAVVRKMLATGMQELTGKDSLKAALGVFFTKEDIVGLKVNCLGKQHLSTHPDIAYGLAEGLLELGLKPENVIIFERKSGHMKPGGYEVTDKKGEIQCMEFQDDMDPEAPYVSPDGKTESNFPNILTKKLTKIINLPVMKNHRGAGVTGALKNMAFGLLDPTRGSAHNANCTPFIVDVCQREEVKKPCVLHVMDAILCGFEGGPGNCTDDKKEVNNTLYFSVDPVALDYVMRDSLNAVRKKRKMAEVKHSHANHIEACAEVGLGIADPKKIDIVEKKV